MIGGTWTRERVLYRPVAHATRTVNPVHAQEWAGPDQEIPTAPPAPDYGEPGDNPWAEEVLEGPGAPVAMLSTRHDVRGGHDQDDGQQLAARRPPQMLATGRGETYRTAYHDSMAPQLPPFGEVRGANAHPENNPEGIPVARHIGATWADRRRLRGHRVTDRRVTLQGGPAMPDTSLDTVPEPEQRGHYAKPFSVWARPLNGPPAQPMLRRVPEPIDESVLTDGSELEDAGVDGGWLL